MFTAGKRVQETHFGAIRRRAFRKKVWVGTDEWTDIQGHAVINILLGVSGKVYVIASTQLDCKGPNLGVEHSELGGAVIDTLTVHGILLKDVYAFVSGFPLPKRLTNKQMYDFCRFRFRLAKGIQGHFATCVPKCTVGSLCKPHSQQCGQGHPRVSAKQVDQVV